MRKPDPGRDAFAQQAIRLADVRRLNLGDDSLARGRIVYPDGVQIDEALSGLG